jgi:hypothetical protein
MNQSIFPFNFIIRRYCHPHRPKKIYLNEPPIVDHTTYTKAGVVTLHAK